MTWNNDEEPSPEIGPDASLLARQVVTNSLGKGCLAGLGLAAIFVVISGAVYLFLSSFDLPRNLLLLFSIASGPIVGNVIIVFIFVIRSRRIQSQMSKNHYNETTPRDAP
jgi:uncharacterized integral membrane protein